jgi:hypothetical protein
VYVHYRLAQYAALNVWGYRGPTLGRKQPGERRIAVVGGSTVFGVGFPWRQSSPALLEQNLRTHWPTRVSVANLGFPGENAYAYRPILEDFGYLNPDIVVLYGDNNVEVTAPIVLRRQSALFRLTGYYPLLPTALREKAMSLRYGGDLGAAYRHEAIVFEPSLATRTEASALAGAAAVADALQRQLGKLTHTELEPPVEVRTCGDPWAQFCDAMYRAIAYARERHQIVLVVNQPYFSDRWIEEQQALRAMLRERFQADRAVHYLDLGWAVDLKDHTLAYDGMHLTPAGNQRIADRLTEPVLALLGDAR